VAFASIIITDANATMSDLHHRMPVILEPEDRQVWLGKVENDLKTLLRPSADDVLRVWK